MTISGEETIPILYDALKQAWWVPTDTEDLAELRRAALMVLAERLTPEGRFLQMLGAGAFEEAQRVLATAEDGSDTLGGELPDAVQRLATAREDATRRMITNLDALRHRSERLGRPWDDDFAALLASMAEDNEAEAQAELKHLADAIYVAEEEMAATLIAEGDHLDSDHLEFLRDLVVEKQWDAARHLVEHGSRDFATIDRPTTPTLGRLGVAPAALFRSLAKGQNPSRPSDGWREIDEQLSDLISRIPATGTAQALADALRCKATVSGDTTTLHALLEGARAAAVTVTDVHLRPTERNGELSVTLEGFETGGVLSLERTLQVLLSPGDRSWQLLRAIVGDWSVEQILGLTRASAPTVDRIEAVLDLALRSPQAAHATVVAHRAGFNMALAEALLVVALPLGRC